MRKLLINPRALLAILCLAIEALAPLCAEVPPGPKWLETAVFYQIYPQSFFDSNGDGIGDLPGITAKLDYIQSIGCNAIWINPIYESPFGDAGYDVADFYKVAPRYGTNEDLKNLCAEAHKRGIHVCLDLVAGHTSIAHPWFQQSALDQPNRYSNWYIWTPAGEVVPGSQPFPSEHHRSDRYLPNFFPFQPALNYGYAHPDPKEPWQLPTTDPACIAVREELKSVMKFWLDLGADGFRVDMAPSLIRNDSHNEAISALWRYYRSWLDKEYPEAVLVSEWSDPAVAIPAGFHIDFMIQMSQPAYGILLGPLSWPNGYSRDPHAFFERAGGGDIKAFVDNYLKNYTPTKSRGYISMPTANHDIPRPSCGRDEQEVRTIFAMLLTMPGVPLIYYGDEIGMNYLYPAPDKEGGTIGTLQRCGSRTPMQWSKGKNAGFSSAPAEKLYLPIDPSPSRPDVATEEKDPASMLNFTRALLKLRRDHPALANAADFQPTYAEKNTYPFVYLRTADTEKILVSINPAAQSCSVTLKGLDNATPLLVQGATLQSGRLRMDPVSFGIFAVHAQGFRGELAALKPDVPGASPAAEDPLLGTWKLQSLVSEVIATGQRSNPFGDHPDGYLSYSPDGRMYSFVVMENRPNPRDADPTDEEKLKLQESMIAYAGTYTVNGESIFYHVDISWNQSWTGTHQVRFYKLDGDTLTLTTAPARSAINGQESRFIVAYKKIQ
jgi:maltose alpha-D-glucosyltransferase/alpha-amylase